MEGRDGAGTPKTREAQALRSETTAERGAGFGKKGAAPGEPLAAQRGLRIGVRWGHAASLSESGRKGKRGAETAVGR